MNPYVTLVLAALDLTEKLLPEIQLAIQKGQVTPEQQLQLQARAEAWRKFDFSGSHWQPSGRSEGSPQP